MRGGLADGYIALVHERWHTLIPRSTGSRPAPSAL